MKLCKLSMFNDELYKTMNGHGMCNDTVCPECKIDDFVHSDACSIGNKIHEWYEEQIAILLHKANVYADLSGWAPKYLPDSLKREINGRLQDKFMFGSDYPEIPPKRWLDEFESGGYKPEVIEKVLYKNAQCILGVGV